MKATCIHCGKGMACGSGVAHHRCSKQAQDELVQYRMEAIDDEGKTKEYPVKFVTDDGIELVRRSVAITFMLSEINPAAILDAVSAAEVPYGSAQYSLVNPDEWHESLGSFLSRNAEHVSTDEKRRMLEAEFNKSKTEWRNNLRRISNQHKQGGLK